MSNGKTQSSGAETTYIGIDLAWSGRNPSGVAALRGDPSGATLLEAPALLGDLQAIGAYVCRLVGDGPALVAVDAPLRVPNASGRRPAEAALAHVFQRYEAGAHPANRRLLDHAPDGVRGEALVALLATHGFHATERIEAHEGGRLVTEVYPHAAMVGLFGLTKTLKYKARGRQRGREERLAAWSTYQHHLRTLAAADPPLVGHDELLGVEVATLRGAALKGYEDRVDALLCAYIALYAHRWGAERCRTFGDLEGGWILTPAPTWY
jgi:predicted RNase H-like nuclease